MKNAVSRLRLPVLSVLGLALLLLGAAFAFHSADAGVTGKKDEAAMAGASYLAIRSADGITHEFTVEIAQTPQQQTQGLMGRTTLADNAGMLFLFPYTDKRAFWMKDTLIPLDMLFIAEDGEIHHIHHMAQPLDETKITSERQVKAVLEIKGGQAGKLGISEGDRVIHPAFPNTLVE